MAAAWEGPAPRGAGWVRALASGSAGGSRGRRAAWAGPQDGPPFKTPLPNHPPTHPPTHCPPTEQDDVPEEVKQRRLAEIIAAYRRQLYARQGAELGRRHLVLVEGPSRRSGAPRGVGAGAGRGWGRLLHVSEAPQVGHPFTPGRLSTALPLPLPLPPPPLLLLLQRPR